MDQKAYEKEYRVPVTTIALGDSENDIKMLKMADHAILVKHPYKRFPTNQSPKYYSSKGNRAIRME